ncbi:mycothiol system anti-sigma-R factor [Corynebacterium sp. H130]|uniref:mycothiol system anti-sigma-R factor n=1 Tax=Corynebacterium sp. H130 TaxID=3133444 RepID=UPI0030A64F0B
MTNDNCACHCTEAYALLAELLDGNCTHTTRAQLRAQIERCPECFERLCIEEEVREILRKSCAAQAPVQLRRRISISIRYSE